jgi:LEA14-like dessication related protein
MPRTSDGTVGRRRMKMNRTMGMVLLAVVVPLAACVSRVQQPEVSLQGARLASLGLSGGVIEVRLSVHNPNRFAVETRGLTYDLSLRDPAREGWVEFTEGRIDDALRVPGRDTMEVTLPVQFSYRGLDEALRALISRGSFEYRLSGIVELEGPVRRDIRYQHTGRYSPNGED